MIISCERCGQSFQTPPSKVREGNGKFCSRACYWQSRTNPDGPREGRHARICEFCSATFYTYPAKIKQGGARFCSQRCYWTEARASFHIRFWQQLDRSGECWLWTGPLINTTGYGKVKVPTESGPRHTSTHRYAWELTHGPIPPGMLICHHCDVRHCCNPDHLFLGTHQDNASDRAAKGRSVRGEQVRVAKMTWEAVAEARRLYAEGGWSIAALARQFGVTDTPMSNLLTGKSWRSM